MGLDNLSKRLFGNQTVTSLDRVRVATQQGDFYSGCSLYGSIANDALAEIYLKLDGVHWHASFEIHAGGDARFNLFENPTISSDGTPLNLYNNNRVTTKTTTGTAFSVPTVTNAGTVLINRFLPGGSGPKSGGGNLLFAREYILNGERTYLMRLTNVSGSTQELSMHVLYYEQ